MTQKSSMNVGDRDLSGQLFRKVGGYQGRSGQVRKISTATGVGPRTIQPMASHYTGQK